MRKSVKTPRARRRLPSRYMRGVLYERTFPAGYHSFADYTGTGIKRLYDGSKRRAQRLFAQELRDAMPIKNPSRSARARENRKDWRSIYNRKAWRARQASRRAWVQDLDSQSPNLKKHWYAESSERRSEARYGYRGPNTDKLRKGIFPASQNVRPWRHG